MRGEAPVTNAVMEIEPIKDLYKLGTVRWGVHITQPLIINEINSLQSNEL